MEKKQNLRSNQLPAKVLNSDSRKSNQDASGKQQTRNYRRREFSSNNQQSQKTDRSYKQPQPRSAEKRNTPRPRNVNDAYNQNASTSGTRLIHYDDDVTEPISNEFEFELNSVYLPGSKKQNLNHLLNFNYAPRDRIDSATYMRTGNIGKGQHGYLKRVKYNKEQFVQANCQFVVGSKGDYSPYSISPDLLVDWSSVEQIHIFGGYEEPQCPICLYHPVAAKMTRCGHVYCWPCILHYLALSDKKSWRKCPICYEAVHIGDLKSAVSKPHHNYSCDEHVTFQLMYRDKNSLQVHEAKENDIKSAIQSMFPFLSDNDDRLNHSKLVLARPMEILSIIRRERDELKCQLVTDGVDCSDSIFVQQALDLLLEREECIRLLPIDGNDADNNNTNQIVSAAIEKIDGALAKINLNANATEFMPSSMKNSSDSTSPTFDLDDPITSTADNDINISPTNSQSNPDRLYFYQANDGQNLYLHSINVRMLQARYGSLEHAPITIQGRILQKESFSMIEELRKRLKYLQHLPVTCQFDVVEIEFVTPDIMTEEIRLKFNDELAQRQKNRQRRAREEYKREKYIDRENERRIGKIVRSTVNIDVTSDHQFPICGSFDETAFPGQLQATTSSNEQGSTGDTNNKSKNVPSFAKMLTSPQSGSTVESWPTLGRTRDNSFSACFEPSNRSSAAGPSNSRTTNNDHTDDDETTELSIDDIEAICAPPEYTASFGSAIAEALNGATKNLRKQATPPVSCRPSGGKKKKNNNKMVLFSTGGRTFDGNC